MPVARVDYEEMASRYDLGRDQPATSRQPWHEALVPYVDRTRPLLDLGAGTGQWSTLLAEWFGLPVLALDPSSGMLRRASSDHQHHAVAYLRGSAESVPLVGSSVGTAWLSAVWHHIGDRPRAASELRRVVAEGGSVCLRGAFPDSGPYLDSAVLRAFPEARDVLDTFPSIAEVADTFESAGFRHRVTRGVQERFATSRREVYERACQRADTLLRLLPDDVYVRRLADLKRIASAGREGDDQPSVLTMLVFA